jgi:hypothetical protein
MSGPPSALLLAGYALVGGVGTAAVASRNNPEGAQEALSALSELGQPTDADAVARKAGIAAANAWRVAAAAEFEVLAAAARKREAESKWFADYTQALRDRAALRAQVERSAAAQVERNKAVSGRATADAVAQGVADPPRKKGIFSALRSLLPGGKKKSGA